MMRSLITLGVILALTLMLASCESRFYEEGELLVQTDKEVYAHGDSVRISITNTMDISVYVRRCGALNFRYAVWDVGEFNTGTPLRRDQCSSFNQGRVEIPRRSSRDIAFILSLPTGAQPQSESLYRIHLNLSDVYSVEPSSIPAITNPFRLGR